MTDNEQRALREGYLLALGMMTAMVYELEPPARPGIWRHIWKSCELLGVDSHITDYARARAAGIENGKESAEP